MMTMVLINTSILNFSYIVCVSKMRTLFVCSIHRAFSVSFKHTFLYSLSLNYHLFFFFSFSSFSHYNASFSQCSSE
ncbi:hypothetical protein J3Q64DRAFT_1744548 [Phycomyces blakesleeanus]|uniref:Uncharacterized protein n=1 Tax=Phycomyces blakesleeanus TaxID=4837 RepID=A0ABR3AZR4_PHYBL